MRTTRTLAAAALVAFWGALCAASCGVPAPATPPDSRDPTATPEADEAVGEAQEDLLKIIRCTGNGLGAACERKCAAAGVWCPSRFTHPHRPRDGGDGELFQCRELAGARTCWYYYEAIDEKCIRAMGSGVTFCSDQDERP
jgi:hypothetical protein